MMEKGWGEKSWGRRSGGGGGARARGGRVRRVRPWVVLLLVPLAIGCGGSFDHDLIVRGGVIYDGSGEPGFVADLAIDEDRISQIGDLSAQRGRSEIDASGLAVSPGFINMLSWSTTSLLVDGLSQGDHPRRNRHPRTRHTVIWLLQVTRVYDS